MSAPPGACDVLVAGLGPVGLLLTALLRRHGVDVAAVERDLRPSGEPRAAVLDDEALRAVQAAGVASHVVDAGVVLEEAELRLRDGRAVTLMRTPARTANGQPALVGLHQPELERRLDAAAGPATFRGWEVVGLGRDDVRLRAADGTERTVRARFVVGCDGAGSAVRRLAGLGFGGTTFAQRWLVADAAVRDPGLRRVTFTGDPRAPAVTLPLTPSLRRWEVMVDPAATATPEAVARMTGPGADPVRSAVYTFHARTADRWRAGRVLLAGDAAHVMPPFAGQGLGSGLRDAVNLAWKLAAVVQGRSSPALLDTYEAERRPHAVRMTALARLVGAIVQTRRPRVASARDRTLRALAATPAGHRLQEGAAKPPPTLRRGAIDARSPGAGTLLPQPLVALGEGERAPLDDLLGTGWAVVARAPVDLAAGAPPAFVLGADVADPSGLLEGWFARTGAAAALVRPDRHVCATARAPRDAAALVAAHFPA